MHLCHLFPIIPPLPTWEPGFSFKKQVPPVRVLLIAEACNPEWVSVPLVGWSHARAIAALNDTHLVTQVRNRDAILRAGLVEGKDFTAIDSEAVARRAYRMAGVFGAKSNTGWTVLSSMMSLAYPYFEHLIWEQFGDRIAAKEFDVVHRLIPLSPASPSLLATRCRKVGVPFVIGPLNGGLPWPPGFEAARKREGEHLPLLREMHRLMPGYYSTRRDATAIIAASRTTLDEVPRAFRSKTFYVPENAIDPARFTRRRNRRATVPLKVVFVGRVVPCKAMDLFLEAAAQLIRDRKLMVEIVGDGPDMPLLKAIIHREGLGERVHLTGWVEHTKVQDSLVNADLFAFPSIRDFGGGAALEAMAVGVAPIIVDYGGPAELVTDTTGFVIPLGTPSEIRTRLRKLLEHLVKNPDEIDQKAAAALTRAHTLFTWEYKAQRITEIYRWAVSANAPKPSFSIPWGDAVASAVPS
jgi:glycosyltransferase involved in cell wall biosynthesis